MRARHVPLPGTRDRLCGYHAARVESWCRLRRDMESTLPLAIGDSDWDLGLQPPSTSAQTLLQRTRHLCIHVSDMHV